MRKEQNAPTLVSVGGGKGGVGKSLFAANAACLMAIKGMRVVLADADLGGANVHTFFGITLPERTLKDFLRKEFNSLEETLIPSGVENLKLLCGASALLSIANPNFAQKEKLRREISRLDADVILVDVGAGATLNNLDFYNTSKTGVIVTAPTPTAIQNAYGFLKLSLHRKILRELGRERVEKLFPGSGAKIAREMEPRKILSALAETDGEKHEELIEKIRSTRHAVFVNLATEKEGTRIFNALSAVSEKFLGVKLDYLGHLPPHRKIEESVRRMKPFILSGKSPGTKELQEAVEKLLQLVSSTPAEPEPPPTLEEFLDSLPPKQKKAAHLVLNDDVSRNGTKLHVQTEDLGPNKKQVVTLVFRGGEVLFSKTSTYEELGGRNPASSEIQDKVHRQHKTVITGILRGKLDERLTGI